MPRVRKLSALGALPLCLLLAMPGTARAQDLLVSAAASLREAFTAIGRSFEEEYPGGKVFFNFGASGALAAQIEQGAPVDVFASANQAHMDRLDRRGLILASTRRDFTANALVLIQPAEAKAGLARPADLLRPEVRRLAMGDPATVPAGQYAKQALRGLGLWEPLRPKLVLGADVRQVREYVVRGEVEAGLVFASDATVPQVRAACQLDPASHDPATYPAAALKTARDPRRAQDFLAYLLAPASQEILRQRGFQPAPPRGGGADGPPRAR